MFICMLIVIIIPGQIVARPGYDHPDRPAWGLLELFLRCCSYSMLPFGFNAILGLIALAGILMRNTLILIGQIKTNKEEGLDDYHAVVEATVQRSRPVILTAHWRLCSRSSL